MATFKYSTLGTPATFAFTTTDILSFDDDSLSASDILSISQTGNTTTITTASKVINLTGFSKDMMAVANFVFADGSQLIVGDGTITGSTVDAGANILLSSEFDDYLDGMNGSDTASYVNAGSSVSVSLLDTDTQDTLGAGTDILVSIENLTGSIYNDNLTGNAGANILDGGLGIDTLTGGTGSDTYYLTAGDTVIESGAGTDKVFSALDYALTANVEQLELTGTAVTGIGNTSNNTLIGNSANNFLDGVAGTGSDTMRGLAGNDTYYAHSTTDVVDETISGSSGTDLVISTATFTLTNNVENLRLMGGNINGTGNAINNIIYAGSGDNTMDGGAGTGDTLSYQFATNKVTVTLDATSQNTVNSGTDSNSNFENLIGSSYSDILTGNSAINTITGGRGNDTLVGASSNDTLIGGLGNDNYVVDTTSSGYVITELASQGTDTITYTGTTGTYTIATLTNIENLTMGGTSAISGTGNTLANVITGNTAANTLNGGAGDDTLSDGGASVLADFDTLIGGTGNDTYFVTKTNAVITEAASAGTDLVSSTATYSLNDAGSVGVDNLTMTGSGTTTGTGNSIANIITGSSAGDNTLNGAAGDDTISDAGGTNTLIGGAGTDKLTGGSGNDTLTGGIDASTADTKIDTMTGGLGNDTYNVTDSTDVVVEKASEGSDTVNSTVTFSLNDSASVGVENLNMTGNTTGTGNSIANTITGGAGNNTLNGGNGGDTITDTGGTNTLVGGDGIDFLTGGTGADTLTGGVDALSSDGDADTMTGGTGSDTYNVTDDSDIVNETEVGDGDDLVNSTKTFVLNDTTTIGVERLTLKGSGNINATGNSLANTIIGNVGNNVLTGGAANDILTDTLGGNDTLDGGTGADNMAGGLGDDIYIVDDTNTVVTTPTSYTGDRVTEAALAGTDLVRASVTYTLTANVEKLELTGGSIIDGTGNTLANTLTGNAQDNILIGGDNADILIGGNGNDLLVGGTRDTGDVAALDPGVTADADNMSGGAGNDTYSVDFATDVVTETGLLTNGTDLVKSRVTYTISDVDVENLTLTGSTGVVGDTNAINGTGNASANTLTGNAGINSLFGMAGIDTLVGNAGADTLDGGAGADNMQGGAGADTYIVDDSGDTITESGAGEIDLVKASATYIITDTLVENLTLTGTTAIDGTGNNSDNVLIGNTGNNFLTGLNGNDTINGGTGADTMIGGIGNDTYTVDNIGDFVDESTGSATVTTAATAGLDTVLSSVNHTIIDVLVENLTLTGSLGINATGNSSANILTGNSGANVLNAAEGNDLLIGGAGKDTITGGDGADVFRFGFTTAPANDSTLVNFDVITDFSQGGLDKIDLTALGLTGGFVSTAVASPFTSITADSVGFYVSGNNTFLVADGGNTTTGTGDGVVDFKIQLTGFTGTLSASDFIFS